MDDQNVTFRASKASVFGYLICSLFFFTPVAFEQFHLLLLGYVFFGMVFLVTAIQQWAGRLTYTDGTLAYTQFGVRRQVNLRKLREANKVNIPGPIAYAGWKLRLTDTSGQSVSVRLSQFKGVDANRIVDLLHPFIFKVGVDKNFMSLERSAAAAPLSPRQQVVYILTAILKTVVFVLLPLLLISVLVVMWANNH